MPAPQRPRQGRGIALGVLGTMLLVFFSLVFMMGKHHHMHAISQLDLGLQLDHPLHQQQRERLKDKGTKLVKQSLGGKPQSSPSEAVVQASPAVTATAVTATPSVNPVAVASPKAGAQQQAGDGLTQLDRDYTPTREMVQKIAQDGYLVVTWANWHYHDFVRTWVSHCLSAGITGYIVGAMDDHLLQVLIDQKRNVFSMKSGLTLGDFGWGSKTFAKMGREKIRLIKVFLDLDVQVIISDVDAIWLRNPIPYFQQYPDADILTSSDHLANTVPDYQLEKQHMAGSAANIGIMLFRKNSMKFVEEWIDVIEKDETIWDQNAFNDLFRKGLQPMPDNKQHLFKGYHGSLTIGILPVSAFCGGHTFFVQRMYKRLKLQPYAVHATFQFSGTPGKRHRLREFMLFDDPPEYYDHATGFISFKMDGLQELLGDAGPNDGQSKLSNVQGHFRLVTHEILRIRTALAIGSVLGRAVIMPELWCGQDRWWAPHQGTIPGANFDLPFVCPMDHVFNLESGLTQKLPVDTYGPHIDFREYSFLDNPKTPDSVKRNKVVVEMCHPGEQECSDGTAPAPVKGGKVRVQTGLMSEQLRVALRETAPYKLLEFSTMQGAFKNFTSPVEWTRFFNRVKQYGSIWCCVNAHPGHVHYDPWFDIPHVDKFNRQWDKWEPTTGP